jgi:hypothetical protein
MPTDNQPTMIAVIPAESYREALLGDGPCGSRAPWLVYEKRGCSEGWRADPVPRYPMDERRAALPILWQGKPVPDGIARAVRAIRSRYIDFDLDFQPTFHLSGMRRWALSTPWAELVWAGDKESCIEGEPDILVEEGLPDDPRLRWLALAQILRFEFIAAEVVTDAD